MFLLKLLGLFPSIEHILGSMGVFPASLELRTSQKHCEDFLGDLVLTTRFLEFLLLVPWFPAIVATFQVRKGSSKADARIYTHVMFPGDNAREVLSPPFNLIEQEQLNVRMAILNILASCQGLSLRLTVGWATEDQWERKG